MHPCSYVFAYICPNCSTRATGAAPFDSDAITRPPLLLREEGVVALAGAHLHAQLVRRCDVGGDLQRSDGPFPADPLKKTTTADSRDRGDMK